MKKVLYFDSLWGTDEAEKDDNKIEVEFKFI